MRDYGPHIIPNVSAAPATGTVGQQITINGAPHYWQIKMQRWVPFGEWIETVLVSNYTNATTTLSTLWSFAVESNAVYEIEWKALWSTSALVGMKQATVFPNGAIAGVISVVSGVRSGTTAPTFLELGVSGTSQNGPAAGIAATATLNTGSGIIDTATTAGSFLLQAAATGAGTLTVMLGSIFKYRRIQ